MFEITQKILEKTEARILELPSDNRLWNVFTRYIVFPLKYLKLGLGEFFKPAFLWAIISFVLLVAGTLIIQKLEIASEYLLLVYNLSVYVPAILVIFAVPSTYSYYGVQSSHVEITTEYIRMAGINTIDKVELLEENVQRIFERISSRISFYKWLIGAFWAVYVVFINVGLKVSSLTKENLVEGGVERKHAVFYSRFHCNSGSAYIGCELQKSFGVTNKKY